MNVFLVVVVVAVVAAAADMRREASQIQSPKML